MRKIQPEEVRGWGGCRKGLPLGFGVPQLPASRQRSFFPFPGLPACIRSASVLGLEAFLWPGSGLGKQMDVIWAIHSPSPCLPLPTKGHRGRSRGGGASGTGGRWGQEAGLRVRAGQGECGPQEGVGQGLAGGWELGLEVLMPLDNK